jgi:hypothetical protein
MIQAGDKPTVVRPIHVVRGLRERYHAVVASGSTRSVVTAKTSFGRQWEARWTSAPSSGFPYAYGDLGVTASTGPWALDLHYSASSLSKLQCLLAVNGRHWCEPGAILTMSYAVGGAR